MRLLRLSFLGKAASGSGPLFQTPSRRNGIVFGSGFFPQAKSSNKCFVVAAGSTTRRQLLQLPDVASPKHHFVRLDGSNQAFHDVGDIRPPFFLAILFEAPNADVVLKSSLLVRQVPQLHRLDHAIHDQGGSKAGSQTQKKHLAAFVTSQRLHGSVVHDFDRALEGSFEVKTDPSLSQIPRFRNRPAAEDWSRVTDGYDVILPVRHKYPNLGNHPFGRKCRSGLKPTMNVLTSGQDLHVSSANINDQHVHDEIPIHLDRFNHPHGGCRSTTGSPAGTGYFRIQAHLRWLWPT